MSNRQAGFVTTTARLKWAKESLAPGKMKSVQGRWYAQNTREPIRDETLRNGLIPLGAIVERPGVPTTSSRPRYALAADFVELLLRLHADRRGAADAIADWQQRHLSRSAMNRITILRQGKARSEASDRIAVMFPNGESRLMIPGPSTVIAKAVVEQFARLFLREPAVVMISESGDKVVARDEALIAELNLKVDQEKHLPDIILMDVASQSPRLVFVEVVATDGAITDSRRQGLSDIALKSGLPSDNLFFVTAFEDRSAPPFRKLAGEIAWGTFVWFAAEPDRLLAYRTGTQTSLTDVLSY
jgi:hypothetical protein